MPTWSKRSLRGSLLEEMVNRSNEYYKKNGLALIQKIPTPITPVEYDNEKHQIKLAYFEKKSTVDYIGVVQGVPVCFDAKECANDRFRISNIHQHQYEFMKYFEQQEGIAFILIYYSSLNKYYYMRYCELDDIYKKYLDKSKSSFHIDELDDRFFLQSYLDARILYLEGINLDLELR